MLQKNYQYRIIFGNIAYLIQVSLGWVM